VSTCSRFEARSRWRRAQTECGASFEPLFVSPGSKQSHRQNGSYGEQRDGYHHHDSEYWLDLRPAPEAGPAWPLRLQQKRHRFEFISAGRFEL